MQSNNKKVSVIIPTFNRAAYICAAIDSVINQNYGDYSYEVLVIDDGSTDNTAEVLKKYKNKIKYIKLPHSGKPAVPRNYGISKAKGQLIAFQDSDDIWPSNKMEIQLSEFDDNTVMTYGQALIMDASGKVSNNHLVDDNILEYGTSFKKLIKTNAISTLTVIARKDAIISVGGFNESDELRAIEDYELWLKLSAKYSNSIKMINKPLAYYRKHDNNISISDGKTALKRIVSALESVWDFPDLSDSNKQQLEKQLETYYINYSRLSPVNNTPPLISVIMPVYNGSKFLRDSINSILAQTYNNFELIVIDDGSKDDSYNTIKQFDDDRIRLLRQTNHGLPYTLNKAVSLARGQYIARQDQDDVSLPNRLAKEIEYLLSNPNIALVGAFFTYFDEKTLIPGITITQPFKDIDIRRSMLFHNPFGHGTVMFKKDIFKQIATYTGELGPIEDFELWSRVIKKFQVGIVPETLYLYRLNSNGMSSLGSKEQLTQTNLITEGIWNNCFTYKKYNDIINDALYYKYSSNTLSDQLFNQYVSQNMHITKLCLERGWIKWGVYNALAIRKIDKNSFKQLRKPIVKALLKKVNIIK